MTIRLTNTLTGQKEVFEPLDPPRVSVYACGPTVYDVPHVGHARMELVFDVLRRHLTWRGYDVLVVRNVTDVDDKIIDRARVEGVDPMQIAETYTRAYDQAMSALGVLPPHIAPRASGHIFEMQDLISSLVDAGCAYPAEGSVYFAVEKYPDYGRLSGRSLEELRTGTRIEPAPEKHHPADFALWKAAKPDEPSWPSPWGPGRPGWHIECSAMVLRYLGSPFDIHGGGSDLIFPHHENEIAEAEAVGKPFARWWLHNGMVEVQGEKMAKSLDNFVDVPTALERYPAPVIRLALVGAQYRSPISYGPEALDEAHTVWERFRALSRVAPLREVPDEDVDGRLEAFGTAMDDDLNTPEAIAALHALVGDGHRALERGDEADAAVARAALVRGLGTLGCEPEADAGGRDVLGPLVELLLEQREEARARKDFEAADAIRGRLDELGIHVEDSSSGPRWYLE